MRCTVSVLPFVWGGKGTLPLPSIRGGGRREETASKISQGLSRPEMKKEKPLPRTKKKKGEGKTPPRHCRGGKNEKNISDSRTPNRKGKGSLPLKKKRGKKKEKSPIRPAGRKKTKKGAPLEGRVGGGERRRWCSSAQKKRRAGGVLL